MNAELNNLWKSAEESAKLWSNQGLLVLCDFYEENVIFTPPEPNLLPGATPADYRHPKAKNEQQRAETLRTIAEESLFPRWLPSKPSWRYSVVGNNLPIRKRRAPGRYVHEFLFGDSQLEKHEIRCAPRYRRWYAEVCKSESRNFRAHVEFAVCAMNQR